MPNKEYPLDEFINKGLDGLKETGDEALYKFMLKEVEKYSFKQAV